MTAARRVVWRVAPIPLAVTAGYLIGWFTSAGKVETHRVYPLAVAALLAVGLYGATSTIPKAARDDIGTILWVVTVGVVVKAALIGAVLSLAFQDPVYLPLGIVMAQIDPLSVAALMKESRLSERGKALLACWASFDDPVTVVLSVSVMTALGEYFARSSGGVESGQQGLAAFAVSLALNTLLAAAAYVAVRQLRRVRSRAASDAGTITVLLVALVPAVGRLLMLGFATTGLFLRPRHPRWPVWVERAVRVALLAALVLLGLLLPRGVHFAAGVTLGAAAFCAQVPVALVFTRRFGRADRVLLALSQQNGLTAILLALAFAPALPWAVGVVAVGIMTTNSLHYLAQALVARRPTWFGLDPFPTAPDPPVGPDRPVPAERPAQDSGGTRRASLVNSPSAAATRGWSKATPMR